MFKIKRKLRFNIVLFYSIVLNEKQNLSLHFGKVPKISHI